MEIVKTGDKPVDNFPPSPVVWYCVYTMPTWKQRIVLVRRVGSSLTITIPATIARAYDLDRGDEILYSLYEGGLSVTKIEHGAKRLAGTFN